MQSTFNNTKIAPTYCDTFNQKCGAVKVFINFVTKLVKKGLRRMCIDRLRVNYRTDTALIIKGK